MIFGRVALTSADEGRTKYRRRFAWWPRRIDDGRTVWFEPTVETWWVTIDHRRRSRIGLWGDWAWVLRSVQRADDVVIPANPKREKRAKVQWSWNWTGPADPKEPWQE